MIQVNGPPIGAVDRELTNIKERALEDSLFRIPDNFRKIKPPAQGGCGLNVVCTVRFY